MARAEFGELLKALRTRAGWNQLDLALEAELSQRHLSFLETGRAGPSREVIQNLSRAMGLGPMELNALLLAAGFAPVKLDAVDNPLTEQMFEAARFMMRQQSPAPSLILRETWQIVDANREAVSLVNFFSNGASRTSLNGLFVTDLLLQRDFLKDAVTNFADVADFMAVKAGLAAHDRLTPHRLLDEPGTDLRNLLPLQLEKGGRRLNLRSTLVTIGTSAEASVGEIRLESFYPQSDEDALTLKALTQTHAA